VGGYLGRYLKGIFRGMGGPGGPGGELLTRDERGDAQGDA
jgi:hypothetical protein